MAVFSLLTVLAATSAAHAAANKGVSIPNTFPDLKACANEPLQYSCENTTSIQNTCCSPTPGGLVLQTQFWSTYTGLEKKGQLLPEASWTIHGLWPDNCDGSFEQYCDLSRQYDPTPAGANTSNGTVVPAYTGRPISTFITDFGRNDLTTYMNKYWINQGAPNSDFWGHEFSKHATCTSTFDVACYDKYEEHMDVINFFDAVIRAFKMYPTYDILAANGIIPSNKTSYSLSDITAALKSQTGATPYLGCKNGTVLSEVWYYSHVLGSEQYGHYKTLDTTSPSTCNSSSPIWYYERTKGSEHNVL